MASQPNITLPDPILSAVQEEAERQHKTVDEMAGELVMRGLHQQKQSPLDDLLAYGREKAKERYPDGLTEDQIVDIVHAHRQRSR